MLPNQPLPYIPPQRGRWAVTYDAAGVMNCAFVLTLCLYHDMGVLPQYIAALPVFQKEVTLSFDDLPPIENRHIDKLTHCPMPDACPNAATAV